MKTAILGSTCLELVLCCRRNSNYYSNFSLCLIDFYFKKVCSGVPVSLPIIASTPIRHKTKQNLSGDTNKIATYFISFIYLIKNQSISPHLQKIINVEQLEGFVNTWIPSKYAIYTNAIDT